MVARQSFRVGLVQMSMATEPAENLAKADALAREAAARGAELVCLPELYRSRYFCQSEDHAAFALAESVPGPSTEALGRLAKEKGIALLAPVFERRAAGVYHNSVVILDAEGKIAGLYRKMHIPDDPLFYEKFYFTPGDLGFQAFDVGPARIGALICWDQWYPEAARLTALRGAAVLFYPTAIGWHPSEKAEAGPEQRSAWQTIQRAHAIANGVYVAAVNRVGREVPPEGGDGLEFWGGSFLADPFGVVLAEASPDREEVLVGEVSLPRIEQVRTQWPFLRDRRIDAYAGIDKRLLDRE
jgi:N-carbamoylputrescine amidase